MADVQEGTFDYLLTKPADSQLLASVREFRIWRLTDVVVGAVVMLWGLLQLDAGPGFVEVAGFLVTLAFGVVMIYCVWLMLSTGAFWFVRMEMLQELFTGLYRAGQYPVGIYPGWLRAGLTFIVPIGFAVTVPSESLTGRLGIGRVGVMLLAFVVLAGLTRMVWHRGVRRYDGASA